MITGSLVAMVTPLLANGQVDTVALTGLVEYHVTNGTQGLVAMGTTGESATLTVDEHIAVVAKTVELAAGRLKVIAGTGANSTREAIELAKAAQQVGAEAALTVVPYYNKPSQEGMYQHFKAQAEAVAMPFILYNVPGRTVADMNNDTALRLAEIDNIVGIKDATGDIGRACDLIKRAPADFALYSGDDATSMAFMLCGGHGVISVTGNVAPRLLRLLCDSAMAGKASEARVLNDQLQALHSVLFKQPSPAPTKWCLSRLGLMSEDIRLPLLPVTAELEPALLKAMQDAHLI